MSAFVVILPDESKIRAEDIESAFQRCYELIDSRAWLVWDDDCYSSDDASKALSIGDVRTCLVMGVTEYAGYGDQALANRLRRWTSE